jgi:hypothetical protein
MNLLSIDPGAKSGYAIILDGSVAESGEFNITSGTGAHRIVTILSRARALGCRMVLEDMGGFRPGISHKVGCACGQFIQEARELGMEWTWAKPNAWAMDILECKGNTPRAIRKELSRGMAAAHQSAHEVKENEADAICIGLHVIKQTLAGAPLKWRK